MASVLEEQQAGGMAGEGGGKWVWGEEGGQVRPGEEVGMVPSVKSNQWRETSRSRSQWACSCWVPLGGPCTLSGRVSPPASDRLDKLVSEGSCLLCLLWLY